MLYTDYLEHYGIKGMKWGVRRYQNRDGSLTNAGKKRAIKYYNLNSRKVKKAHNYASDLGKYGTPAMHEADEAAINLMNGYLSGVISKEEMASRIPEVGARQAESRTARDQSVEYQLELGARYAKKLKKKLSNVELSYAESIVDKDTVDLVNRYAIMAASKVPLLEVKKRL